MISSLENFIHDITNLKVKIVENSSDEKVELKYKTPILENFTLYFEKNDDIKKIFQIKLFLEDVLNKFIKYRTSINQYIILKNEIENFVKQDIKSSFNESRFFFSFFDEVVSYALLENDFLVYNKNLDKFTIEIYKKKLDLQEIVTVNFKNGEIFALKVKRYKLIMTDEEKHISPFIKDIIKSRLNWLNIIYEIRENSYIDNFTKLYNREKFLIDSKNHENVIFINIKNFKKINLLYGSKVGDKVLKELSKNIKKLNLGRAYRLFSDHFALILQELPDVKTIRKIESLQIAKNFFSKQLNEYVEIKMELQIAIFQKKVENIIEKSNLMFKRCKKDVVNYSEFKEHIKKEEEILTILSKAISKNLIVPYFHKIVKNSPFLNKAYYEALMRIEHNGKIYPPGEFITVAKNNGLYTKLNMLMIENSIKSIKELNSPISINIDIYDILQIDFVSKLKDIIKKYEAKPEQIYIEILETEDIYKNLDRVKKFLKEIRKLDLKISLDDFGSGYSNFVEIKDLEIDNLKIDMSIVKEVTLDEKSFKIVKTVAEFGKSLNLKVTAEGVGSKEIYDKLKNLPIDYMQGFYFAKPASIYAL